MKIRYILMFVCFAFSNGIFAGTVTALINGYSSVGTIFYFSPTVAITGAPACNTQGRFAVDTTTQAGQNIFTAIINAKNEGLSVSVTGNNLCTLSPTSEGVSWITVR